LTAFDEERYICKMKILLVVATQNEVEPFLLSYPQTLNDYHSVGSNEIKVLVTSPGILATSVNLCLSLHAQMPDLVMNVGICGAINRDLVLGEVIRIDSEALGDFGAESKDGFIPAENLGLINSDEYPFNKGKIYADGNDLLDGLKQLKSQHGITVQKVHGDVNSISTLLTYFPEAEVESMEGAAVFYASKKLAIPCCQVRSISNYVEVRNREKWNIPLAIETLNDFLFRVFSV
jgi:futalosine hydrolase